MSDSAKFAATWRTERDVAVLCRKHRFQQCQLCGTVRKPGVFNENDEISPLR